MSSTVHPATSPLDSGAPPGIRRQTGLRLGPAALTLLLASAAVLGTTGAGDGYGRVLVAMLLLGAGAGFVITSTSDAIAGSLPDPDLGVGSATNTASIQLGAAAGVAVSGSLLSDHYRSGLATDPHSGAVPPDLLDSAQESLGTARTAARHLPSDTGAAFADAARRAFVDGLGPAMATGVGITALGIVTALICAPSHTTSAPRDKDTS